MEQNDRLEKNKDFFQGKELFNTKLLRKSQRMTCKQSEWRDKQTDRRITNVRRHRKGKVTYIIVRVM